MRNGKQGGAAPDCSYLSKILHVYGGLYDFSLVYLCKSCGNVYVYIVHAGSVSILCHAHIPHKYILQASDAELMVDVCYI